MASVPPPTIYPQSHVGFDSITSQIERKLLKRGFQFNIMCVGACCSVLPISLSCFSLTSQVKLVSASRR